MVSNDGRRAALIVTFAASGVTVLVEEADASRTLATMGVTILRAGRHRTACGKGYMECAPGEPEVLVMRWDGIDYFKNESADSVFYVPERGAAFSRVWLSD